MAENRAYPFYFILSFLFICSAVAWYYYDRKYLNLFILIGFFLSISSFYQFSKRKIRINELRSSKFIVETYNFTSLFNVLILSPYITFNEYFAENADLTITTFIVILLLLSIAVLQFITDIKSTHYIDEAGIHGLNGELMIDASKIEEIDFLSREIVFHTKGKRNDLMIKKYRLASPDWNILIEKVRDHLYKEVIHEQSFAELD